MSQRRKIYMQRSRSSLLSTKIVQNSNQGRAGIFVLILLTVLTMTWLLFIVLHIYDFQVHKNDDKNIINKLNMYNCSGEDHLEMDFPKLSFLECVYQTATLSERSTCLSRFKVDPMKDSEVCGIILKLFHGKVLILAQNCAIMLGMLNSLINPIIYGFWYSQFRIRIVQ